MLFNSYIFMCVFLPIVIVGFYFLRGRGHGTACLIWLCTSSLFFYGWWNPAYIILIVGSILTNYLLAQWMFNTQIEHWKRRIFYLSLLFNLGLLGFFKYADFILQNVNLVTAAELPLLNLVLPLAISFFTLQQIAYQIDAYQGLVKEHSFLKYSLFVSFFPQLIAGPIVQHKAVMPQFNFEGGKYFDDKNLCIGIFIFCIGLFKKVCIADNLAIFATAGFENTADLTLIDSWISSLSYTFQLYFDFSGYTDMAIGAATVFNVHLPVNFKSPYKASNLIDFWQRWHITLTSFITSYVYTPLVRCFSKITFGKMMFVTFVTMAIAGVWHGAAWTFVLFGVMHGVGLVVNHFWKKGKRKLPLLIAWFITFNYVNLTFVVFRASSIESAGQVVGAMFGFNGLASLLHIYENVIMHGVWVLIEPFGRVFQEPDGVARALVFIIIAFGIIFCFKNAFELKKNFKPNFRTAIWGAACFTFAFTSLNRNSEFLYFNF
ncbi:MBOAT family protein [Granulosicoccus sp.]|nr:MBOAT family O-acyltransferase [Granulosicoccus sp.]MDB4224865.1 MBOAT family protein [Granulosicoccus sp.]